MVDIVTLYEDPWVNPTGSQDVPHHLNPYIYGGIGDASYKPLYGARLCTLTSALSCIVTEEINGIYTLDMEYPIDGVGADYIKIGRVISAKNNPFNSSQLFRIIKITRTLRKTFKVSAEHLSYDLDDYTIQPFSVGQFDTHLADMLSYAQGLDWGEDGSHYPYGYILGYQRYIDSEQGPEYIKQNFPFRFVIDGYYHTPGDDMPDPSYAVSAYPAPIDYWSTKKTMYSEKVSTVREFIGGANTGLLATFGGELWYNISDDGHADVIFTKQRGTNRGFVIKYGKNLMSMTYDVRGGKRHSAWYPYYRYCSNADNHEYLFWDIEDDLMNALDILHDLPVPPFEGQIKRPSPDSPYLVYDHYEDVMTYVNIFPVDITQYADLTLKASGYTWEELVETSDTLSAAEKRRRRVLRSYVIVGGLQSYFEASGASYAPTSSEVTCDFETLYGPGSGNEYKKALEELRLGDTVTLLYDEAGHSEQMRIRKMEYDSVTGRYKKLTLGSIKDKKQSAAASIASSSLHSEGQQEKQYSNAASFTTDVKKIIGQVFDNDVFATTPLGKEYHIDPNTGDPILTINASGIGTIVHGAVDPLYLDAQNHVNLRYSSIDFLLDRTDNNALKLKNPLPAAVTGEDEDKYLYVDDNGYISWDDLRLATSSVVGGIKTGYTTSGTNFAVQLDQNGKAFVAATYSAQNPIYLDGTTFKLRYGSDFVLSGTTLALQHPLPYDGSDGQVLMWSDGPDWTTLTTSDISNIETWISGKSYATTTYVNEIASGLSAAYAIRVGQNPSFNSQSDYITITGPITTTTGVSIPLSSLKVGDVVYVVDTDIPDRWVSSVTSSSATLYTLETVKPAIIDVQINSNSIVSNRIANIALNSSFSFNTTNNTLSLQKAGSSILGGIKTGYVPAVGSKDYAIMVDSNGNAHVVVPWESVPNGTNPGDVLRWNSENDVWEALAPSWYLASNPNNYISRSGISATGAIAYNNSTGVISVATGYKVPSINSSGSDTKYFSEKGNWVSLPSDVNTWRDIGVNGEPWKGTGTGTGPIDFTNDTGISITTGTGQNANKLYIGHSNSISAVTTAGFYKVKFDAQGHITGTASVAASDIPDLAASKITSGTFDAARIPSLSYTKITGISGTSPISYSGGAISLSNAYGDTKNPYGTKTPNYVLAGPASGTTAAVPTFRALVAKDIPNLTSAKITDLGDVATLGIGTGLQNDGGNLAIDSSYISGLDTWRPVKYGSTTLSDKTTTLEFVAGSNVQMSFSSGKLTVSATDTTYESKAAASGGTAVSLVTTGEKYTWNAKYAKPSGGIPASDLAESYYLASNPNGYTSNTGTVTSVTLTSGTGITVSNSGTAITTSGSRTISLNVAGAIAALGLKQLAFVEASTNDVGKYLKAIDDGDAVDYEWATPPDTKYTLTHPSNTNNLVLNQNGSALNTITLGANAWNSTSIPTTYLKSASVSGSTLTLTKQDNGTVTFTDTNTTYSFQEGSTDGGFQYKVNSGSWQNIAIHNAATIAYVNEKAAGLSASYAINTSSSVNPAFNVQTASITVTSFVTTGGTTVQASSLKVGDTVYVTNSDIPDRWVGAVTSSNATLYILETAKPAVVDIKFDSTSLLNTSTRVATLNHGKAISFNTTDKTISVNIDTNTMAYVDSDTKIGVDTTIFGDLAWLDSIPNNVTGSGTNNYLAKWTGANTIGDAVQYDTYPSANTLVQRDSNGSADVKRLYVDSRNGTTSSVGESYVMIGNNVGQGSANNSKGFLRLYGYSTGFAQLTFNSATSTPMYYYLQPSASQSQYISTVNGAGVTNGSLAMFDSSSGHLASVPNGGVGNILYLASGSVPTWADPYTIVTNVASARKLTNSTGDLDLDVGGPYNPVYFDSGVPVPCTGKLASSATDSAAYAYRKTKAGTLSGKLVKKMNLTGATVAWNQLMPGNYTFAAMSGITITQPSTGTWRINGTASGNGTSRAISQVVLLANHVYLATNGSTNTSIVASNTYNWTTNKAQYLVKIGTSDKNANLYIKAGSYTDVDVRLQYFDITTAFGETVANRIYALESASAGAGIAKFRELFEKGYYPFSNPTLMSFRPTGHKTTGFNRFNGYLEQGSISGYGVNLGSYSRVRSAFIRVDRASSYGIKMHNPVTGQIIYEVHFGTVDDGNAQGLGYVTVNATSAIVTTPDECTYLRVLFRYSDNRNTSPGDWANSQICVYARSSAADDSRYEPYWSQTYALDASKELCGVLELDANDDWHTDGDAWNCDGTIIKRKAAYALYGTEVGWVARGNTSHTWQIGVSRFPDPPPGSVLYRSTTALYGWSKMAGATDIDVRDGVYVNTTTTLIVTVTSCSTLDEFKAYLARNPIGLCYDIDTRTEQASPFSSGMACDAGGTEEFLDSRDIVIPGGVDAEYQTYMLADVIAAGSKYEFAEGSVDGTFTVTTNGEAQSVAIHGLKDLAYIALPTAAADEGKFLKNEGMGAYSWSFPDWNNLLNKPTMPTITLNGSTTTSPSFYAPTTAGTNGYLLKSNGSGAPTWIVCDSSLTVTHDNKLKVTYPLPQGNVDDAMLLWNGDAEEPYWANPYTSKPAVSGGTDVSLVTTGEKYIWNAKVTGSSLTANEFIVGNGNSAIKTATVATIRTKLGLKQLAFVEAISPDDVGKYLKAIDDGDAVGYEWSALATLTINGTAYDGTSAKTITITDTKVKLNAKTDNSNYRVLLGPSSPTDGSTSEAYYANTAQKQLSFNPSNGDLRGVGLINGDPLGSLFSVSPDGDGGYLLYDPDDPDYQYQWITPPNDKVSMTANTGSTALSVLLSPSIITSGNAYGANYANTSGKQLKFTPSTGNLSGVAQINGSTVPSSPKFTDTLADYITEWYNEYSDEPSGIVKYAYDNVPALYLGSVTYSDMVHSWSTSSNIAMLTMTNTYSGSTNPVLTLSSYPVQNSGTVFKLINNTAQTSNNWLSALDIMAPNMTASSNMNYANFTIFNCGKAASDNNRGSLVYHHTADGSVYNCLTMGFYGNDHVFRVYAYGGAWIYGSLYVENGNKVATETWVESNFVQTCLIKGTKILMADGTEKNIEDVKRGDEVRSIDINSGKLITSMIVSCEKTGVNHEYTTHLFDNGSYIVTYGQHSVYNKTLGHPIDISKFRIGDETYDAEGNVITYAGNMRYYDRSTDVAHYDINTSNNLYFANGILNGKNVFAKYRCMRRENMDIPDSILAVLNRQETANKPAIGYETDSNYFRAIAAKLKEKSTIAKRIEEAKQKLADSDYLVAKFTEGLISAVDWLKAKAERGNWRTAINNDEPLLEAADNAIKAIKAKYQTDDSSVKDRFELFSAWDNAALEYYREWLTKEKPIDIPGPLTEEERHGSYANQDLT